ncbi:TonB-dependent hemoglobin/transferrin/lactoferrin family receptor [Glaciecola sp. XM2]|uniref:TonB-dependent hemoglobin/transferrin/lactoferrin family receptor n=1 Tax=Glaciecola sp. XM2 TaxID=1914931 RepID=UPI001BDE0213|nr:TonB-dependent hemoglobin/transferrin/lactoferrin family receptor [Glaciecola sp. XM2]MBT1450592.1 TonB-dependent hemoglobin/transferrin/lactoferrin family receptor [Glaciecola sp. XM2]
MFNSMNHQDPIPKLHNKLPHKCAASAFAVLTLLSAPVLSKTLEDNAELSMESIETISVSGTRTSREINEIAASVTRISSEKIDAISATNIRDMLRYEPGISVEGNGRYGLSSFNIRGINGDRVLILLDGVPIADEFSFGPNLSARRDFVDIDLIGSVDIVRGPASTLYGSDAIGGVVAFKSKDPSDLLDTGESFTARAKLGFASESNQYLGNALLAGSVNNWQWLISVSHQQSDEFESFFTNDNQQGSERKSADPQDNDGTNGLAKLIYSASDEHRFELTIDGVDQHSTTNLLSESGEVSRGVMTTASQGIDSQERARISGQYTYQASNSNAHLQRIHALGFYQKTRSAQDTQTSRNTLATQALSTRTRFSEFEQDISGLYLQFDHRFDFFGSHYLIYGSSYENTDSISLREGQTLSETGTVLPEFSVFPARDFPPSELTEWSVFIQDEITLLDGSLTLSPGLRYDRFSLNVSNDPIFSSANPGVSVEDYKDNQVSAKLGAVYRLSDQYSLWYQYAEGFRIPPMDDVNVGFTNFAGGYTSLANPELEAESVVSHELGLRGYSQAFEWSVSAYVNQYDDFIESLAVVGFNPETRLLEFQARNIDELEITGFDLQATWFLGEQFDALQNYLIRASHSYQDSEDKSTGLPLDSLLPAQSVVGFSYGDYDSKWRAELAITYTDRATVTPSTEADIPFFQAPSHTLVDLIGHYQVNEDVRINLGLFNITDEEYYLASEVRGRTEGENLARFSSAGRNVSMNVVVNF